MPANAAGKIRCVSVTRLDCGNGCCVYPLEVASLIDEFDGAEIGERVIFELCEMTEEQLNALPEFEGW